MVANHKPLIIKTIQELQAGVQHLEYSYRKVQKIPLHKDQTPLLLETRHATE